MPQGPPEVPRAGNKYAWVVGIVMLMGIARAAVDHRAAEHRRRAGGPAERATAARLRRAAGHGQARCNGDEGDANVCQRREGCNDSAGNVPACELVSEEIFNVCERAQEAAGAHVRVRQGRRLRAAGRSRASG